jgi:serine protease Do
MPFFRHGICVVVVSAAFTAPLRADEQLPLPREQEPAARTVEELAEQLRPSVVVITVRGRDARREGLGTGFVISKDGLIATSLHVIGEGRPIAVETAGGKKYDVTAVEATDRAHDLALIRLDAKDLPALSLGDSANVKDGQPVVALGNPHGLRYSVVKGVVSGRREIDGQPMIQLAIPVEPGNSGGPVVDLQGRVVGVLTLKSLVTENLGFATAVNSLKPLIARPNPVKMEHWVTIGALDPEEWQSFMGARWRQRAGRIQVEGAGSGFGGRSICVSQRKPPELPYEVSVTVKLNDERGAAGLIFRHDGERHYGFYPTGGKLRLTRFEGPDVYSWRILDDISTPHYRPGDWNTIKVRLEKDGLKGYVNGELVLESKDTEWAEGQVGLTKFRDTIAEFKSFRLAKEIPSSHLPTDAAARVLKVVDGMAPGKPVSGELLGKLATQPGSTQALRNKARDLETQAAKLRELSNRVHQQRVYDELAKLLDKPEAEIDLIHAALLLSKLDNEELDVEAYRQDVDRMAKKIVAGLPKDADERSRLKALNQYLFEQAGFHGSRNEYYSRSNSYLNEVIDDREGLPITLSVLYIEVGRRIGLNIAGIGLPGHFIVRHLLAKGEGDYLDVFDRGKVLTADEVKERATGDDGEPQGQFLKPVTKRAIIVRMLHNLLRAAQEDQDADAGLRYLDGIMAVEPSSGPERFMRAALRFSKGMKDEAREDVDYLVDHPSDGVDRRRLMELKRALERE